MIVYISSFLFFCLRSCALLGKMMEPLSLVEVVISKPKCGPCCPAVNLLLLLCTMLLLLTWPGSPEWISSLLVAGIKHCGKDLICSLYTLLRNQTNDTIAWLIIKRMYVGFLSRYWDTRQQTPVHTQQLPDKCYALSVKHPLMVVGTADRNLIVFNLQNPQVCFLFYDFCVWSPSAKTAEHQIDDQFSNTWINWISM